jgi:hypothetical protein
LALPPISLAAMSQTAPAPFNSDVQAAIDAAVQAGIQAALRQGPTVAPQPSSIVPATAAPAPVTEGRTASPDGFVTVLNPRFVTPPSSPAVDASSSSAKAIPSQVPSPSLKPAGVAPRPTLASIWGSVRTDLVPPSSPTPPVAKQSVPTPPVNPDDVTVKKAVSNPKYAEKIDYANFVVRSAVAYHAYPHSFPRRSTANASSFLPAASRKSPRRHALCSPASRSARTASSSSRISRPSTSSASSTSSTASSCFLSMYAVSCDADYPSVSRRDSRSHPRSSGSRCSRLRIASASRP